MSERAAPRRLFSDVRSFEEIDSTNSWLLRSAGFGLQEGTVVVADAQSAGRGRLGRRWESPARSGLLASILFRPRIEPEDLFCVSAIVALAARQACRQVAGVTPSAKWPNDLVVGDLKIAGLLAETSGVGTPEVAVVVGIGVNVSWPMPGPAAAELRATCLDALSERPTDRRELLEALLDELETRRPLIDHPAGRVAVVSELADATVTLGRRVRVELASETFSGTATGLDERGRLLVSTGPDAVRVVAAGDVVHLR